MLDIKWIRENPNEFDNALKNRGLSPLSETLIEEDATYRRAITELQELQNQRKQIADEFKKPNSDKADLKQKNDALKQDIAEKEDLANQAQARLNEKMLYIPNVPSSECPIGKSDQDNVEVRRHGSGKPSGPNHVDVAGECFSSEKAVQMSGSRFSMLFGPLARLERALSNWMLDQHTQNYGYIEVQPPLLVKDHAVQGTGQLPSLKDDMFRTNSDHWLIPTSEVSLTNIVAGQILSEEELPLRYTACTPCFRLEAGAAGKDTQGLIRQHQFHKVELVSITTPGQSKDEHERMTEAAESILKGLELPYRTVTLCTGDMGFGSEKTYDIEVWLPSQSSYREISSCSRCNTFQSRRMNARFRPSDGGKPQFLHTLNGTGVAIGRALVAVLENYGNSDGEVNIPSVLVPYMNGIDKIYLKNCKI